MCKNDRITKLKSLETNIMHLWVEQSIVLGISKKLNIMCRTFSALLVLVSITFSCSDIEEIPSKIPSEMVLNEQKFKNSDIPNYSSPFPYCQNDLNPIGGGRGYNDIFIADPSVANNIIIDTEVDVSTFKNIVEGASSGAIIFIKWGVELDLSNIYDETGEYSILVPEGVSIVSDRGGKYSQGALIYTNDNIVNGSEVTTTGQPLFIISGNNVRFSGLRFKGPFQEIGTGENQYVKSCIRIKGGFKNLEVDNSVFYGWPHAAIIVGGSYNSDKNIQKIHHNYFFNNRQEGLGYGVLVNHYGFALIESNLFKSNRHDIAGKGYGSDSYEASCNTILSGGNGHNFDMHGNDEPEIWAGRFIYIHHNDFRDIGAGRKHPNNYHNILIRGTPRFQCKIENNRFKHNDPKEAIYDHPHVKKNLFVWNNIYGSINYRGWYVNQEWLKTNTTNFVNIPSTNDELIYNNTTDYVLKFGDYEGNFITDIFKFEGDKLYKSPLNLSISDVDSVWVEIATIPYPKELLDFTFANNDNITDILFLREKGGYSSLNLNFGPIGDNLWVGANYINTNEIKYGDFDGNGYLDAFTSQNSNLKVSYNLNSQFININSSNFSNNQIFPGRFNNNNSTDIFASNGSSFFVSYDGVSSWNLIANESYSYSDIIVEDFNQDNFSDIIDKVNYKVLDINTLYWSYLTTIDFPINDFSFGDF